jgi:hypothetical protein
MRYIKPNVVTDDVRGSLRYKSDKMGSQEVKEKHPMLSMHVFLLYGFL